jgi:hypothetical protein
MMLVTRCLSGALNGNVAVIKASLGDITDAGAFSRTDGTLMRQTTRPKRLQSTA